MFDNTFESKNKIKIIIVDDHGIIRDSLRRMLNTFKDLQVIGTACNGEEAYNFIKKERPDIVLMDAVMPVCDGIKGTKLIKEYDNTIKILMLTTFSDKELIYNAFNVGVDGYILKDIRAEKLFQIIKEASKGELIIPSTIATILVKQLQNIERLKEPSFNQTEDEIILLLIKGLSNKEISQQLNITYGTTRNYISSIYNKLNVTNRALAIKELKK